MRERDTMIKFTDTHVEVSLPVAAALAEFAGKDTSRLQLGAGINKGHLAATDGYRAVVFDAKDAGDSTNWNGLVWPRSYVERAVKVARAMGESFARLTYADSASLTMFPPLHSVMPKASLLRATPVGFNPRFVGAVEKVCKACETPYCKLTTVEGPFDTIGITVEGPKLSARVAIMPARV